MRIRGRYLGLSLLLTVVIMILSVACATDPTPESTPEPVVTTEAPTPTEAVPAETPAETPEPGVTDVVPTPTEAAPDATAEPTPTQPATTGETPTPAPEVPVPAAGAEPQDVVAIALNEENNSGQSGLATLTAMGDNTQVVVSLSEGTMESSAIHIHSGQCGPELGDVVHPLTNLTGGSSTTLLEGVSLGSLLTGGFAINSHNADDASIYTACGNIPADENTLTIPLNEENDSGQSGFATLTARDGNTEVVISLSEGTMESSAVHIHSGQCGPNLGDVVHPLTNITDGTSTTLLEGVSLDSLVMGDFAINAHNADDPSIYTACGNIQVAQTQASAESIL
jgi:Cu/Zn superoxide dismutase